MIVGFCGYMQSGKDTAADHLVAEYGFEKISFAAPLKEFFAYLFDIPVQHIEQMKTDKNCYMALGYENEPTVLKSNGPGVHAIPDKMWSPITKSTVREGLRRVGKGARDLWGEDFWVDQALPEGIYNGFITVADVRYPNEARRIKNLGGKLVRIHRIGTEVVRGEHESEDVEALMEYVDIELFNDHDLTVYRQQLDHMMKVFTNA